MNDKLITALLAIVLALGGWSLQRSFSLSQDMVVIKMKIEVIQNEIQNFKALKGKKNRKKKKGQGNQMDEVFSIVSYYRSLMGSNMHYGPSKKRIPWSKLA